MQIYNFSFKPTTFLKKVLIKCYLNITFYNFIFLNLKRERLQQSSIPYFFSSSFAASLKSCTFAIEFSASTRHCAL